MKVLLINPPARFVKGSSRPRLGIPIGLLSVAGLLEKEHEVKVYDTKASLKIERHGNELHFGDSFEAIKDRISRERPDVVGISNPYTVYSETARKVAQTVKDVDRGIKVVAGGPHATIAPGEFLADNNTDFVVMREGEFPFLYILRHLDGEEKLEKIGNIAYKERGRIRISEKEEFIQDLDSIPFPAYHLVDMEVYFKGLYPSRTEFTSRSVPVVTSRGCPYKCNFCSIFLHMGRQFRFQSPDYVVRHVKLLVEKYRVELIHFEDDNMTLYKKRFEDILDGWIENGLKFKWDTPNGVRADALNMEMLEKCKLTGCQYLIVGVESGNQNVVNNVVQKQLDLKNVVKAAELCKEAGIPLEAFFIVGFPGETIENMRETFEFAKMLNLKYGVYPTIHVAVPLLNTPLFEECKEKGYFVEDVSPDNLMTAYNRRGGIIQTPDFGPVDIEKLFDEYKYFLLTAKIKKGLKHPHLIKSTIHSSFKELVRRHN